ncbi:MAG: hypothetical protein ACAH80_18750 [Alphaproteobacteria bacterium]
MAKSLEEVRDDLYAIFTRAATSAKRWEPGRGDSSPHFANTANAAASAAEALTQVEREIKVRELIDQAQREGSNITIEMDKGLGRRVNVPAPIKLKSSE